MFKIKATRDLIFGMFGWLTLELLSPEKQLLSYLKTIQFFNDFFAGLSPLFLGCYKSDAFDTGR